MGRRRSTRSARYDAYLAGRERIDEASAIDFLTFDRGNPSSICNCLENARANGRAVRTALTVETWTAINDAWLELKRFEAKRRPGKDLDREALTRFLDYVKKASLDFDGSCYRTMLRNDAYWFNRLGVFVERADNTARLLDVKYHLLLPSNEEVGGSLDYFQWVAILRAVSAATAYHWVYRDRVKPWLIADLLDPQAGDAALADRLLRRHRLVARTRWRAKTDAPAWRSARRARRWPRWSAPAWTTSFRAACTSSSPISSRTTPASPTRSPSSTCSSDRAGPAAKPKPKHAHRHRPSDDLTPSPRRRARWCRTCG